MCKNKKHSWQKLLQSSVTDLDQLLEMLSLSQTISAETLAAMAQFPLKVPMRFIKKMAIGDPHDPLLRQVLPDKQEMSSPPGYSHDPLAEQQVNPLPGLLHKYKGRVLITSVATCGINCRYCFRRHFPYQENLPGKKGIEAICEYIAKDRSIVEVILSGGDPLMASDAYLSFITQQLGEISHVKTLRVHSRLPIVLPERITDDMIQWFCHSTLKPILVTHCNHPAELDDDHKTAMAKLKSYGALILNQSVLLKGVNDDAKILAELSRTLFDCNIMPYYINLLDKVSGSALFELPEDRAKKIYASLLTDLPGYLVPKFVKETANAKNKQPISVE